MAKSDEEEMADVLAELGVNSLDELEAENHLLNPIPAAPVSNKKPLSDNDNQALGLIQDGDDNLGMESLSDFSVTNTSDETKENLISNTGRTSLGGGRELTIQSLVHLMGLPTGVQVSVLDTKLDLITAKLGTIQSKLERLQSQFDIVQSESQSDRMEFQLTEIRSIMKKFFPAAFANQGGSSDAKLATQHKPQMLSSKSPSELDTKKETLVHINVTEQETEEEPLSDQDYQTIEARKMREKSNQSYK